MTRTVTEWGTFVTSSALAPFADATKAFATPDSATFAVIELFRFDDLYEIALGLCVVFLLIFIGWSVLLRRKVREQSFHIREQFEREAALQKQFQELFEHANDAIFSLDRAGLFLTLNHTGEVVLGCPRDVARGMKFNSFLQGEHVATFNQWLVGCGRGEAHPFEAHILGSQGKRSVLELVGRPVPGGDQFKAVEVIARDITARKEAEDALKQSEERFSSAFRASPVAIALMSYPDGRITDVNASFVQLFGYGRSESVGHTALELGLWADAEEKARVERALRENSSVGGVECRFKVKTGEQRMALVFMEKITTGDLTSVLWLSHDMTDRLTLEAQVRHLLKMEAVGRLAAGVAHDFNNLLTVIQGNIILVLTRYGCEGEMAALLNNVTEAAQRAANLTRQLLTFSRKNHVTLAPLDLNLAVTNATRMFKHLLRADIRLRINFAPYLPAIQGDATMLEQVLMNLVVNARDAMPNGGELTVTSSVATVDRAYAERHPEATPGEYVRLEVSDTGCGMDSATLARIFEPFFTTKTAGQGTGLGLATVYGIVKQHKGWIEVISERGMGTTFKVFIPADRSVRVPPLADPRLISSGSTVLLLEDEPAVLELMGRLLSDQGYRVLRASCGLEAMQLWSEHTTDIKLLLTDVRMPDGMSGYDVAENLLALNPDLKVLIMSGYSCESTRHEQILHQGAVFLPKPCPPRTLNEALDRLLASKN